MWRIDSGMSGGELNRAWQHLRWPLSPQPSGLDKHYPWLRPEHSVLAYLCGGRRTRFPIAGRCEDLDGALLLSGASVQRCKKGVCVCGGGGATSGAASLCVNLSSAFDSANETLKPEDSNAKPALPF